MVDTLPLLVSLKPPGVSTNTGCCDLSMPKYLSTPHASRLFTMPEKISRFGGNLAKKNIVVHTTFQETKGRVLVRTKFKILEKKNF